MKYLALLALVVTSFFLGACASTSVTTAASDPVPGEKTSDEARLAPGGGTSPSATVKW
jgi:hypothetical protein